MQTKVFHSPEVTTLNCSCILKKDKESFTSQRANVPNSRGNVQLKKKKVQFENMHQCVSGPKKRKEPQPTSVLSHPEKNKAFWGHISNGK